MTKTAEHRSYIGSAAVLSRHGQTSAGRSACRRRGFTLVEIVVAMAILLVVVLGMVSSYASYYGRVVQARLATTGQNLAQLQLEYALSMDKSVLYNLVRGNDNIDVNYFNTANPGYPTISDTNGSVSIYNSGIVDGTFYITGIGAVYAPSMHVSPDVPNLDLPAGIVDLQPEYHPDPDLAAGGSWDYTIILNKAVFPGYRRQVVITDMTPSVEQRSDKMYKIDATIFWTVMGKDQQYTVSAEK